MAIPAAGLQPAGLKFPRPREACQVGQPRRARGRPRTAPAWRTASPGPRLPRLPPRTPWASAGRRPLPGPDSIPRHPRQFRQRVRAARPTRLEDREPRPPQPVPLLLRRSPGPASRPSARGQAGLREESGWRLRPSAARVTFPCAPRRAPAGPELSGPFARKRLRPQLETGPEPGARGAASGRFQRGRRRAARPARPLLGVRFPSRLPRRGEPPRTLRKQAR